MAETKKKILIIDDNLQNRKLARDLLEVAGHGVVEANDALSGIGLTEAERPDLILMDYHLPDIDGVEAARRFQENDATKGIPIIVVTATAAVDDVRRIMDTGLFRKVITKPINTRTFVEEVFSVLDA